MYVLLLLRMIACVKKGYIHCCFKYCNIVKLHYCCVLLAWRHVLNSGYCCCIIVLMFPVALHGLHTVLQSLFGCCCSLNVPCCLLSVHFNHHLNGFRTSHQETAAEN